MADPLTPPSMQVGLVDDDDDGRTQGGDGHRGGPGRPAPGTPSSENSQRKWDYEEAQVARALEESSSLSRQEVHAPRRGGQEGMPGNPTPRGCTVASDLHHHHKQDSDQYQATNK